MHSVIFIIGRGQFLLLLYCLRRAAHARGARCCFVFLLIVSQRYRMESKQRFVSPFVLFLRMIPYIMKSQDSWHKAGDARSPILVRMSNLNKCWSSLFAIYDFDHRLCASLDTILAIEWWTRPVYRRIIIWLRRHVTGQVASAPTVKLHCCATVATTSTYYKTSTTISWQLAGSSSLHVREE